MTGYGHACHLCDGAGRSCGRDLALNDCLTPRPAAALLSLLVVLAANLAYRYYQQSEPASGNTPPRSSPPPAGVCGIAPFIIWGGTYGSVFVWHHLSAYVADMEGGGFLLLFLSVLPALARRCDICAVWFSLPFRCLPPTVASLNNHYRVLMSRICLRFHLFMPALRSGSACI